LLAECSTLVIKENEKIEADSDFHDDLPISAGLALQGSYYCAESPKSTGEAELAEKHQKDIMNKLDNVSREATKEFAGIVSQLQNDAEFSDDFF
jgi:hypothetical protein